MRNRYLLAVGWAIALCLASDHVFAQDVNSVAGTSSEALSAPTSVNAADVRETWHRTLLIKPVPPNGCSTAKFPATEWQRVPCDPLPARLKDHQPPPQLLNRLPVPRGGHQPPASGGNDGDISAQATQGTISSVIGSFPAVQVTGEVNVTGDGKTVSRNDQFSLQINSNFFASPLCKQSLSPNCQGWQQSVLSNDPGSPPGYLWTQYWLLGYGSPCPAGWNSSKNSCWYDGNGTSPTIITNLGSNLQHLWMSATISNGQDIVMLGRNDDATIAKAVSNDSLLGLASFWTVSEFNIFGDLTLHQARFNLGTSSIVVEQEVTIQKAAPTNPLTSIQSGTTGETNNLKVVGSTCVRANQLTFAESNVAGATYGCPSPLTCSQAQAAVAKDQANLEKLADWRPPSSCNQLPINRCPAVISHNTTVNATKTELKSDSAYESSVCH